MPIALKFGVKLSKITPDFSYKKSLLIIFIAHLLASLASAFFNGFDSIPQIVSSVLIPFAIICLVIQKELKKFKPNMKQLLIIFSFILAAIIVSNGLFQLLIINPTSLDMSTKTSIEETLKQDNRTSINRLYSKDDQNVYFADRIIPDADPSTFKKTDSEFYIDKSHVFWAGSIVPEASPNSFEILNSKWGKDSQNLYHINLKVMNEDINIDSFALVSNSKIYAKDEENIYKLDTSLEIIGKDKFDYETFEVLGAKYQKDKNGIYFSETLLKDADAESFQVLSDAFSKDKTHIFYGKKVFKEGAVEEIATFEEVNKEYIKNTEHIYSNWGKIVTDADIETFVKISDWMAKDKNNVYGPWGKQDLVDPETFIVIGKEEKYGKDKNGFYKMGDRLEGKELEKFYKDFPEFR